MTALDSDGKTIRVGDMVDFKSDYEQTGKVIKIEAKNQIVLYNDDGFGGSYLRYAKYAYEDAGRCWLSE